MRRSTIALVVLFVALGLLYWYTQRPGNAITHALATSTPTAAALPSSLIRMDQGPVSGISIQNSEGKTVTLKKAGGIWLVTTDREAPANQDSAEAIAQAAMSLRLNVKLDKAPELASIGLDNPGYTVSLTLQDGSLYTFKVGAATVTDSGYYVQVNDGSIGVIDKYAIEGLLTLVIEPPFLQTATPSVPETIATPEAMPTTKP